MSLLERHVTDVEILRKPAPEVEGIFSRKQRDLSRFTVLGSTLLDYFDDEQEVEQQPAYTCDYRLVNNLPHVVVSFEDSAEGRDAYRAFQSGCYDGEGRHHLHASSLPEEAMRCEDLQKAGLLCFSITATDLSVSQIIAEGFQKSAPSANHLRVA